YDRNVVINEAFSRNRGEYTNIIKGNNGFYILKVLEKNDSKTIPVAEVKTMIESELKVKKENEYLTRWFDTLKSRHNIKIYKEKIGGTPDTVEVAQSSSLMASKLESTVEAVLGAQVVDDSKLLKISKEADAEVSSKTEETKEAVKDKNSKKSSAKKSNNKKDKKSSAKSSRDKSGSKEVSKSKKSGSKETDEARSDKKSPEEATKTVANMSSKTKDDLNEVLAEVDDAKITRLMYNETISQLPAGHGIDFGKMSERLSIIDKLLNRVVLKKEAQLAQMPNDPAFKKEIKAIENKILARDLIFEEVTKKIEPSKSEIKSYYEKNNKQYHARHILVSVKNHNDKSEVESARAKAQMIQKKLSTDDFDQVARAFSDDMSKNDGGLLPPFTYDDMVEPFSDAVKAIKPGEVSAPVLTNFGFHIIKLEDVQTLSFSDSKIKEKLAPLIQKKLLLKYIETLKTSYDYKFEDKNIKYAIEN
ncbi:MAG TPA: peptidylprolyl isomerase, partial [Candidatus Wallbacteria bacterium]|nr:peptidylprolyl isomerase [Candidatus Wallbacteria bacterium]